MKYRICNGRDKLVYETDDLLLAQRVYAYRSRKRQQSRFYVKSLDDQWLMIAWGRLDFTPHLQEREAQRRAGS